MGILDDTTIFATVLQQGGFSHAAKYLGLSNGLISRRITQLEKKLGVTLIKRTTRQLKLTPEGELLWQHAQRIQRELDHAITSIKSSAKHPQGTIRISAPFYFGSHYLSPIIVKFLNEYSDIKIDMVLSNTRFNMIQDDFDFAIRGAGFTDMTTSLEDSSLCMKLLLKEKLGLYASPTYLKKQGRPLNVNELEQHLTIYFADCKRRHETQQWQYRYKNKMGYVKLTPKFISNDIGSNLHACINGYGIGRFSELHSRSGIKKKTLEPVLEKIHWGYYHLYAIYPQQLTLPKRTRLFLEYLQTELALISS